MRLLNTSSLEFREHHSPVPTYAIASHRWKRNTEATIEDIRNKDNTNTEGYRKVSGFAEYVKSHIPYVEWLWIDTCCINQESSQEVSEAINSMFTWYRNAEVCLVYLTDVSASDDLDKFMLSEWFRRGWTLQELLAPQTVVFLTKEWQIIGHKGGSGLGKSGIDFGAGTSLETTVAAITSIPGEVLSDFRRSKELPVSEKLEWIAGRQTLREEDMSYSLLGIFGVNMTVIYGEGEESARKRLRAKIRKAGGFREGEFLPVKGGTRSLCSSNISYRRAEVLADRSRGSSNGLSLARDHSTQECSPLCSCACHSEQILVTPRALDRILGRLTVNLRGFMSALRICSEPRCVGPRKRCINARYRFPRWAIHRALFAYCDYTTYHGVHFSLRMPWIVPDDSEIMHCVKAGDVSAVQHMFRLGQASPHCINASWSVPLLNYAVQFQHLEMCKLLLYEGADPRDENQSGISALDRAWGMILSQLLTDTVEEKFKATFQIWSESDWLEEQQFQAIHKITLGFTDQQSSVDLRSFLKLSAENIDCQDSKGRTALLWAGTRGDDEAARVLLEFGANPNLPCSTGTTPLLQAVRSSSVETVKVLLNAGSKVNWQSRQLFTALHYAIYYRDNGRMIQELVQGGADLETRDSEGWTALICAAVRDSVESASVLLQHGACIENKDTEGWTPLLHAVGQNSHAVLKLLLCNGASFVTVTKRMENILHIASRRADLRTVELLCLYTLDGIDPQLSNSDGETAATIYASRDNAEWDYEALLRSVVR